MYAGNQGPPRPYTSLGWGNAPLGLILNVLIVFTTEYEGLALDRLRARGVAVRHEDAVRLSPLVHTHLNLHGRHQFTLAEPLRNGAFRPLRDVDDPPPFHQEPDP